MHRALLDYGAAIGNPILLSQIKKSDLSTVIHTGSIKEPGLFYDTFKQPSTIKDLINCFAADDDKGKAIFNVYQQYLHNQLLPKKNARMWQVAKEFSILASGGLKGWILFKLEHDVDFYRAAVLSRKDAKKILDSITRFEYSYQSPRSKSIQELSAFLAHFRIFLKDLPQKIQQEKQPLEVAGFSNAAISVVKYFFRLILGIIVLSTISGRLSRHGRLTNNETFSILGLIALVACVLHILYTMYYLGKIITQSLRHNVINPTLLDGFCSVIIFRKESLSQFICKLMLR